MASSDQASLFRLECVVTGAENTRDQVTQPNWLQRFSLGQNWPGWKPVLETDDEKLPPAPRRHHRGGHGLGVFQKY